MRLPWISRAKYDELESKLKVETRAHRKTATQLTKTAENYHREYALRRHAEEQLDKFDQNWLSKAYTDLIKRHEELHLELLQTRAAVAQQEMKPEVLNMPEEVEDAIHLHRLGAISKSDLEDIKNQWGFDQAGGEVINFN